MQRLTWASHNRCLGFILGATAALAASDLFAQQGGAGQGQQGTIGAAGQSGVSIDANGVLTQKVFKDPTGIELRKRIEAARAGLNKEVARPSKFRKISLNRLEAAVARQLAAGKQPTEEMKFLAGLTRLQYVFFYPESGDIVLAGPAEGWAQDLAGRIIGVQTGRAVLELQDLIVALRAFPPDGKAAGAVTCSIDPTPEGLKKVQQFLSELRPQRSQAWAQFVANGLRENLGLQTIRVGGISPNTHFAQVMIEADYRMKLIGIGLERPPVKLVSYVERAAPGTVAANAMQRWYLTPNYECVRVSDDELAMELVGDGVKVVGEDEVVAADGGRVAAGRQNRASELFVQEFTHVYPQLAAASPVYAQLRNCIDMLVAAAYMQQHGFHQKAGWRMEVFGDEKKYPVETDNAPKQVMTAVNILWKRNTLMTPMGGGVLIQPTRALDSGTVLADEEGAVEKARAEVKLENLAEGQWWWD